MSVFPAVFHRRYNIFFYWFPQTDAILLLLISTDDFSFLLPLASTDEFWIVLKTANETVLRLDMAFMATVGNARQCVGAWFMIIQN